MSSSASEEAVGFGPSSTYLKNAEREIRNDFVRKVYGILSTQLLVTVLIAAPFQFLTKQQLAHTYPLLAVSSGVMLCTFCAMMCLGEGLRKFPTNYIILGVLTVCMGVTVGFSSAMYTWQSVVLAAGVTVAIFIGMTIYAWNTDQDFTGAGPYLMGAMLCLMCFSFVLMILGMCGVSVAWGIIFYDFLSVLLFTFYIVYDTQLILGGEHKHQIGVDDYCFAALNLYMDIINLFLHILSLLGDRK